MKSIQKRGMPMADPIKNRKILLTYEDYLSMPNDRNRYEILGGELVVTPSPSFGHQKVSRNLEFVLFAYIKQHNLGEIIDAPMDVILDETTVVQPDIIFIAKDRYGIIKKRGIEGSPDLLIEILSPSSLRFDKISKMQIYAKYGVKWYWIVDPHGKTLEEYKLEEGFYNLQGL